MSSLFVYGTLMCADVAEAVLGRKMTAESARLNGYRRYRLAGKSYPAVAVSPKDSVDGYLWRGLSEREIEALDTFEGDPYDRRRVSVQLLSSDAEETAADVYVICEGYRHLLQDAPWIREEFEKNDKAAFLREFL